MWDDFLDIKEIINLPKWQRLQDSISLATGLAIITVDYKGNPISQHSGCRAFCQKVRQDEKLCKICQRCDARGGIEAARLNQPYYYFCHFQIIDVAIPIMIENKYLGAIMAGQVMLPKKDRDALALAGVWAIRSKQHYQLPESEFWEAYQNLPVLSWAKVKHSVEMIFQICQYSLSEDLTRYMEQQKQADTPLSYLAIQDLEEVLTLDETNLKKEIEAQVSAFLPKNSLQEKSELESDQKKAETTMLFSTPLPTWEMYVKSLLQPFWINQRAVLKPCFLYLQDHYTQMPSSHMMAKICNMSAGYFCRLFKQEIGTSYVSFLNSYKIQLGGFLLERTTQTVSQISHFLGYSESNYFIRIFRQEKGITPLQYRKQVENSLESV